MTAPFALRRDAELAAKLESVELEFEYWEAQSLRGAPLEKHYTQIRRATSALRGFASGVSDESATPGGRRRAMLLALDLHEIWDFFRGKLALRCVPWFQPSLIAADDYAWACYEPATAAAIRHGRNPVDVREPPLVFPCGVSVPRAHARGGSYVELIAGDLFGPSLLPALRELPLPVVAVPWYQSEHVPDALAIGHEVGHLVEQDLGLTPTLLALLAQGLGGRAAARLPAWERWLGEVFADVYGCLAAGPAYAGWLLDLLAGAEPADQSGERRGEGPYPPVGVRASLVLGCLTHLGLRSGADELGTAWCSIHPDSGTTPFHEDVDAVIVALLDGEYPALGGSLRSVLPFGPLEQGATEDEVDRLLRSHDPAAGDVRILLAAGTHAFRSDPEAFRSRHVSSRVFDGAVQLRRRGVRAGGGAMPVSPNVDAADRRAGRRLFDLLATARR